MQQSTPGHCHDTEPSIYLKHPIPLIRTWTSLTPSLVIIDPKKKKNDLYWVREVSTHNYIPKVSIVISIYITN